MSDGLVITIGILVIALFILIGLVGTALYYGVIIALIYKFLEWVGILAIGML